MKGIKIIGGFFCVFFWLTSLQTLAAEQKEPEEELQLYALSAVLLDADSGRVLYGKEEKKPMAMASTTKIMTCILVLEHGDPSAVVEVSSYAASMPKVKLSARKGEKYKVEDLLYSLMLESHNDVAAILAEYVGGMALSDGTSPLDMGEHTTEQSREAIAAFAAMMNHKAQELGCRDTWFITPSGLDATENVAQSAEEGTEKFHHTTAEELAGIMAYCIEQSPKRKEFLEITRRGNYSFHANGRDFSCVNHNSFLSMMEGVLSGKTGFTNKAGYCYVGALEREERTFVVALLGCGWPGNKSYKWKDARALMEYGLEHYFYRSLRHGKEELIAANLPTLLVEDGQTPILGEPVYVESEHRKEGRGIDGLLLRPEEEVEVQMQRVGSLKAPVYAGQVVGRLNYCVDGTVYRSEDIILSRNVEKITLLWCLEQVFLRFLLE